MIIEVKRVRDLLVGDIFVDSLGYMLKVEKVKLFPWLGIQGTQPKARVHVLTENGNRMHLNFNADRKVTLGGNTDESTVRWTMEKGKDE